MKYKKYLYNFDLKSFFKTKKVKNKGRLLYGGKSRKNQNSFFTGEKYLLWPVHGLTILCTSEQNRIANKKVSL